MRNLGIGLPEKVARTRWIRFVFIALVVAACAVALFQTRESRSAVTNAPTFGHPVISGIGGNGFEQDIRLDPTDPNRVYSSSPGSLSSDTSWIWHSRDGGKTFKWVTSGTPFQGKVTACAGGGDTELAVDSAGHLYFNDLTLANFSTARSDDGGVSFTCSNTGVPDTAVDRQWYATDGDPTNGGNIYLANDEIGPGMPACGGSLGNNVLVMYRSPAAAAPGSTAGIQFGPANKVTANLSCDEGIMGNNEVSPVATTTGQPNGLGGFAVLPTPVKHIYVIHDNATLDQIQIGRCFPVAFGLPVANTSDPSGLNCTNLPVASFPGSKTGANFPTMAIDKAGNLYAVWSQAALNVSGNVVGDTVLKYTYSTNEGNTWSTPVQIDTSGSVAGTLHNNVFAWMAAGDDGRLDIAWYGTPNTQSGTSGPDSCTSCFWSLWMVQSVNAHAATPTFTAPILASEHFNHHGSIQTLIGGQSGDRTLGDFLQMRMGADGGAQISYADSNNINEVNTPHAMYVRQNGGSGLLVANSPVNIPGLTRFNSVLDPTGDGKYEVAGTTSANMPQLDITGSSVNQITTAPCSVLAPCYQVTMQLNNLSLAPTTAQDPDPDLVWLTQWHVPSTTDTNGGKAFFVYAESTNGGALTCYSGETASIAVGGGVAMTYPGATTLPAANCQSTLGPNGTITIDVPLSNVSEPGAIDNILHEVTASTMTLSQPANTVPSVFGIGGSLFNLIDVAQSYNFDASARTNYARDINGGTASGSTTYPLYNFGASNAIDGDRTGANWGGSPFSGWNDGTYFSYPDILEVDFNGSKAIDEINVVTLQNNWATAGEPDLTTPATGEGILDFDVQYWNGSAWTLVPGCNGGPTGCSITGNDKAWQQFLFPIIQTTKIRVVVNNARNGFSRIVELEAVGAAGQL